MTDAEADNDRSWLDDVRSRSTSLTPVAVAELIDQHFGHLSAHLIVAELKRLYPWIPLQTLLEASAWNRVGGGGLDDSGFNELLQPWLVERPSALP